jgi:molecular chaperone DnaJ
MEKDWYEVLGVPRHAEADEIKAAYRALALQRHPDVNADDPSAGALFMRIHAAYEVLGNPRRPRSTIALRPRPSATPGRRGRRPRGAAAGRAR